MPRREQGRNAPGHRIAGQLETEIFAVQPDVGDDQMDLLALEQAKRLLMIVERRDHLIPEVGEHRFGVERGQRLVLDDEDPLDDPLALTEQHRHSEQTR